MFRDKYNTVLTILLIVAIVAIIILLGYLGFSMINKYSLQSAARDAVDAFEQTHTRNNTNTVAEQPADQNTTQNEVPLIIGGGDTGDGNTMIIPGADDGNNNSNDNNNNNGNSGNSGNSGGTSSGTKTKVNGYEVIGTISIPSIKIEYPIYEKVTTGTLKIGTAFLVGPGLNKVGNTVIQGHNYRNGTFFSNLVKLKDGDDIYITDETGNKIRYKVYMNFEAGAMDGSFYNRDTEGKREITLSTCTEDANTRTVIFAKEV